MMKRSRFKRLFEPGQIGQMQLKNRIVMPAMGTLYGGDQGAQAIHVSAYGMLSYIMKAPSPDSSGFLVPLAEEVKEVASVPVIAVGRLDAELAEQVLEEGWTKCGHHSWWDGGLRNRPLLSGKRE